MYQPANQRNTLQAAFTAIPFFAQKGVILKPFSH
jgi:hypothetical protein